MRKLALLGVVAAVCALPSIARADKWPMWCNGITKVTHKLHVGSNKTPDGMTVTASFKRSARPAGAEGEGVAVGECSFLDRPVRADEPSVLNFMPSQVFTQGYTLTVTSDGKFSFESDIAMQLQGKILMMVEVDPSYMTVRDALRSAYPSKCTAAPRGNCQIACLKMGPSCSAATWSAEKGGTCQLLGGSTGCSRVDGWYTMFR